MASRLFLIQSKTAGIIYNELKAAIIPHIKRQKIALEDSEVFVDPVLSSIVADRSGLNAVSDYELTFAISPMYGPVEIEQTESGEE